MPVRIIGMIGVTPPTSDAALHVIEGGLSTSYLTQYARAHDDAGFDLALVGYTLVVRGRLPGRASRRQRTPKSSAISSRTGRDLLHRR